jgi:hypothetical protein
MGEERQKTTKRDYDKNPIIINNNFTSLVFGITFWLLFNGLIVYLIFFGEAIDWSQNKEWFLILKDEMSKSARLGTVLIGYIPVNVMAFYSLYKNLKNQRRIKFHNDHIESDESFNDLKYLKLVDIENIKKSFFHLIGTGYQEKNNKYYIGVIVISFFIIVAYVTLWISIILTWLLNFLIYKKSPYISAFPYFTIFSKNSNRVINVNILSKEDYEKLSTYFKDRLNIDISNAEINFKISNIKEEKDVRQ